MCTAVVFRGAETYFGRTLDYTMSFGETVTITPRHMPLPFRFLPTMEQHYGIIGMACVQDGYPLYYDGCNEKGLAMAGLNFVGNAAYGKLEAGKNNTAQFELLPWVLGQCDNVAAAKALLARTQVTDTAFADGIPAAQLHWMLADEAECVVLEIMEDGVHIYENPVGVLTNNPPFPMQIHRLHDYMGISPEVAVNRFSERLDLVPYSRGMGALGLPGDYTSSSRFVRAAFVQLHTKAETEARLQVEQFFHILNAVEVPKGCCKAENGEDHYTIYSSCCDLRRGVYYYTTWENRQITAVELGRGDLNGDYLVTYPLIREPQIRRQN